ncbi:MAG: phosphoenolpyruvate carboxylase [Rickettsiales bacterium]
MAYDNTILLSANPLEITHHLTNLYIQELGTTDPAIAALLSEFRNTIWPFDGKLPSLQEKEGITERIINAGKMHSYTAQKQLLTGMMRLGQLYDVAAIAARGNAFDQNRIKHGEDRVSDSTGGVENLFETFIERHKTKSVLERTSAGSSDQYALQFDKQPNSVIRDTLSALSKPIFEMVMTTHPTNVNALESLEQLRNLGKAIHTYRKNQGDDLNQLQAMQGAEEQIKTAFSGLMTVDAIPMKHTESGKIPGKLSVRGEVDMVLFYLKSLYDDLPQVYRGFEQPLRRLQRKQIISPDEIYNPLDLKLNIRASAWGLSGDKDGNKNINADTTLEALLATKVALMDLYLKEIAGLSESVQARLHNKINDFTERKTAYEKGLQEVEEFIGSEKFIPARKFNAIVRKLPKPDKTEARDFVALLEEIYNTTPEEERAGLLTFIRRVRSFGYHFAKIEYRETAEEYARVVAEIVPGYKALHERGIALKNDLENLENTARVASQREGLLAEFAAVEKASKAIGSAENPLTDAELRERIRRLSRSVDPGDQVETDDVGLMPLQKGALLKRLDALRGKLHALKSPDDIQDDRRKLHRELDEIEARKRSLLTEALDNNKAPAMLKKHMRQIVDEGSARPYDKETDHPRNAMPIAYHTIKRMELAREFPEMITANVLAECQNTSNILEAVFLQAACADKNGKRPIMGVVPLFEEPDTMKNVGTIMGDAYRNHAYDKHMNLVAKHLGEMGWTDGAKRQQVQIAHSDNARRSGFLAARAFIDEAHKEIRALNKQYNIKTEFFEGGSISDSYRGGVRSISAAVNEYGLHDFMKFTFQGGDLPNYFGSPGSTVRLFTRNLAHAAKQLSDNGEAEYKETDSNITNYSEIAQEALKKTLPDYQRNIFNQAMMGNFMKYAVDPYGNVGSRAGARGGAAQTDPDKVRTIGFSEMFQHAGAHPAWLGAETLAANLAQEILTRLPSTAGLYSDYVPVTMKKGAQVEDVFFLPADGDVKKVDPAIYGVFYDKSAVFRNAVDGMAFGLAVSNLDALKKNYPMLAEDPFVKRMERDYRAAAHIALGALHEPANGPEKFTGNHRARARKETDARMIALDPTVPLSVLREKIRERLPHLQASIEQKGALFDAVASMKSSWRRDWEWQAAEEKDSTFKVPREDDIQHGWMLHLAHGAIDSVTHGRYLMADDPMYMRMIYPEYYASLSTKRKLHQEEPTKLHIRVDTPQGGRAGR